ncbi:hypothetical protein JCM15124A_01740 [Prevotella falsenii]
MENIGNYLGVILLFIIGVIVVKKVTSCILKLIFGILIVLIALWLLNVFGI